LEAEGMVEILTDLAEKGTNILVLIDDAYFGLLYDTDSVKESFFALLAGIHPRIMAVKLDGATKENYVWGLRVGFITYGTPWERNPRNAYEALEKKTAGAVRGSISNSPRLSQSIILGSLNSEGYLSEKKEKFDIMQKRAIRVREVLDVEKYRNAWEVYPFNSGYFMCLGLKTVDAEELRLHLLNKYGVGVISLGKSDIRVAFSCVEEKDIAELFETIFQGVNDLEKATRG